MHLPKWPLTTVLPVALSLAILSISFVITIVGVGMLHARNTSALEDKATVFLDATAGHVASDTLIDAETVGEALMNGLRYRSVLGEHAIALGWTTDGAGEMIFYPGDQIEPRLQQAVEEALAGNVSRGFQIAEDNRGIFTNLYRYGSGVFAISASFDASEVVEANRTTLMTALAVNAALALTAALISFAITRGALSSLRMFTRRLAREERANGSLRGLTYVSAEVAALETALELRQQSEDARSKSLERLAQAERDALLARVAATLAHEIRNPLAGILSALSTFRRYGDDKAVRDETLDIVESGLDSIGRIADVTLSTYRQRSGSRAITGQDLLDLKLLVAPEARRKGLSMNWSIPHDLVFTADADALRQILVNLLLNACKASPQGGGLMLDAQTSADGLRLNVTDEGPGMPAEILAFLQTGSSRDLPPSRELGIWIVSELAQDMGARLSVESRVGKGTTVSLFIPVQTDIEERETRVK